MALCEFETNLIYNSKFRSAGVTERTCLKKMGWEWV